MKIPTSGVDDRNSFSLVPGLSTIPGMAGINFLLPQSRVVPEESFKVSVSTQASFCASHVLDPGQVLAIVFPVLATSPSMPARGSTLVVVMTTLTNAITLITTEIKTQT